MRTLENGATHSLYNHHVINIYSPCNYQVTPIGTPAFREPPSSSHVFQNIIRYISKKAHNFLCEWEDYMAVKWIETTGATLGVGLHGHFEIISKRGVATYIESPVFPKLPSCHPHSWGFLGQHYSTGYVIHIIKLSLWTLVENI